MVQHIGDWLAVLARSAGLKNIIHSNIWMDTKYGATVTDWVGLLLAATFKNMHTMIKYLHTGEYRHSWNKLS